MPASQAKGQQNRYHSSMTRLSGVDIEFDISLGGGFPRKGIVVIENESIY